MSEERGPWYLLTGLALGVALGLLYAWVIQPVEYTNTAPASLRADFKDQYRALIAAAYLANGDLVRARARLQLLQDDDLYRALAEQAQRTLAGGGDLQEARALGLLAVALGQAPPDSTVTPSLSAAAQETRSVSPTLTEALAPPLSASPTGLSTATPVSTALSPLTLSPSPAVSPTLTPALITLTPLPTRTSTPTPGAPFVLKSE